MQPHVSSYELCTGYFLGHSQHFAYNSGSSILLSVITKNASGKDIESAKPFPGSCNSWRNGAWGPILNVDN